MILSSLLYSLLRAARSTILYYLAMQKVAPPAYLMRDRECVCVWWSVSKGSRWSCLDRLFIYPSYVDWAITKQTMNSCLSNTLAVYLRRTHVFSVLAGVPRAHILVKRQVLFQSPAPKHQRRCNRGGSWFYFRNQFSNDFFSFTLMFNNLFSFVPVHTLKLYIFWGIYFFV